MIQSVNHLKTCNNAFTCVTCVYCYIQDLIFTHLFSKKVYTLLAYSNNTFNFATELKFFIKKVKL